MTAEEFYNEWMTNRFGLNDKGQVHRGALSVNTQNQLMEAYHQARKEYEINKLAEQLKRK